MLETWLLAHEPVLRGLAFFGVFIVVALWEAAMPRRALTLGRWRWVHNLALVGLNTLLLRLIFPAAAVGIAVFAQARGWGLFNAVPVPFWAAAVMSFLVLDLAIWAQHVAFHYVPFLWPLHRMHHADQDIDTTTGLRFHPAEILLSMLYKGAVICVLGAPVGSVLVFEVVLNATSLFNHANARLPRRVDRVLRCGLVTPDMHRVHHSVIPRETNSNFGFNLPFWDRAFGTYRDQPEKGHEGMTIGLAEFREPRDQWLDRLLLHPLLKGRRAKT